MMEKLLPTLAGGPQAPAGLVLILHGDKDGIVPMWCSERFLETYGTQQASLQVVEGENHLITARRKEVVSRTVAFFRHIFGK